jgi:hypothetical protein
MPIYFQRWINRLNAQIWAQKSSVGTARRS